jgi:hypothetical protein
MAERRASGGPSVSQVRVLQWVLSLPKRLRYFLHHEPALMGAVLPIYLEAVEDRPKACSLGASAEARFGTVTFVHRFGSTLNAKPAFLLRHHGLNANPRAGRSLDGSGRSTRA